MLLLVRANWRRTVTRRAKTVMVCCARVMMGEVIVFGFVILRESCKAWLRKVVELFVSS